MQGIFPLYHKGLVYLKITGNLFPLSIKGYRSFTCKSLRFLMYSFRL